MVLLTKLSLTKKLIVAAARAIDYASIVALIIIMDVLYLNFIIFIFFYDGLSDTDNRY